MKRLTLLSISLLMVLAIALTACNHTSNTDQSNMQGMDHSKMGHGNNNTSDQGATQNRITLNTKNVTRINQDDPIKVAVETSQIVWPATTDQNRPGTVLLGLKGDWKVNLPSVTLIHHPNNGPLLYAEKDNVPDITLKEIQRLNPMTAELQPQGVGALQSSSRKKHQQARHTEYRINKNKEHTARLDALIKSKLQPLLDFETASAKFEWVEQPQNTPMPISTRSIGFNLYNTFRGAFAVKNTYPTSRVQLLSTYRHLLLKVTHKMGSYPVPLTIGIGTWVKPFLPEDVAQFIGTDVYGPLTVCRFVDSLGPVNLQGGGKIIPVLPSTTFVGNAAMPRPDNLGIHNLRDTVVSLANPLVPQAIRQAFVDNNPIPGAIYNAR